MEFQKYNVKEKKKKKKEEKKVTKIIFKNIGTKLITKSKNQKSRVWNFKNTMLKRRRKKKGKKEKKKTKSQKLFKNIYI